jgi:hypothetical protein
MRRCFFHVYETNTYSVALQLKIVRLYEEALYTSYYGLVASNDIPINASLNVSDGGVLVLVIILLDFSYPPILFFIAMSL